MDVLNAIKGRRSIRAYQQMPVEDEKLLKVLEAARLSPSAKNLQEWRFVVVKKQETRKKLAEACYGQHFVGEAPVFIAACATDSEGIMKCGQYRYTVDLSIAMSYMILEAYEQGLGTCWIGSFDEAGVKQILKVPEKVRIVAVTPLGYPEKIPAPKDRKKLEEIICLEEYK